VGQFKIQKSVCKNGFIIVIGLWEKEETQVNVVNVYSSCVFSYKRVMWEEIIKCKKEEREIVVLSLRL